MREQVFSEACKDRGFTQCGKSYMRVIGDGVFQHILPDFKERLHSSAPGYSQKHRYEPRILIYIKSMYARYDDLYISIDQTTGFSLNIPRLLDRKDAAFMGATVEMERMLNEGLDVLDTITSQNQIIEIMDQLVNGENIDGPRYSTQLYDIYLYCGEFYKARLAIETEFSENFFTNLGNCKRHPGLFTKKMAQFLDSMETYYEQYMLTFPVQYDAVKVRLEKNYKINLYRLKELGIEL